MFHVLLVRGVRLPTGARDRDRSQATADQHEVNWGASSIRSRAILISRMCDVTSGRALISQADESNMGKELDSSVHRGPCGRGSTAYE